MGLLKSKLRLKKFEFFSFLLNLYIKLVSNDETTTGISIAHFSELVYIL